MVIIFRIRYITRAPWLWILILPVILLLMMLSPGTACAAEDVAQGDSGLGLSPIAFFLISLGISIIIGIFAVLGGVGGGVIFTPLMMGFTPIDSFIIRATGLFIAVCGSLIAARPFLKKGLANMRLIFFAGVPYAIFAVTGALLAGYVEKSAGNSGEGAIRLALGIVVIIVVAMIIFAGQRCEYPKVGDVCRFTDRLSLNMSYWEASISRTVSYRVKRAPAGIVMFCFVGLISGLFGLGAGWAMVPTFNLVMLAPLKVAAASSKVLIGVGDSAAVWPYIMEGALFPLFAVPCGFGMVIGTYVGSKIMLRIKAGFIRYLIIGVMSGSGIKLIVDGIERLV